jgi:hypothetical protein
VINTQECTSKFKTNEYDHSVLVVGYGSAIKGGQYFVVKNSFGTYWGDQGFAKIGGHVIDEKEGSCGILGNLYQPILKKNSLKYNLN